MHFCQDFGNSIIQEQTNLVYLHELDPIPSAQYDNDAILDNMLLEFSDTSATLFGNTKIVIYLL